MTLRLETATLAFVAGVAGARWLGPPDLPVLAAAGLLLAGTGCCWWLARRGRLPPAVLLLIFFAGGAVRYVHWWQGLPGGYQAGTVLITGRVLEREAGAHGLSLVVDVKSPAAARVRVFPVGGGWADVAPGDFVVVQGELQPISGPRNPGQPDARARWHARGIYWQLAGSLAGHRPGAPGPVYRLRAALHASIGRCLPPPEAGLMVALLFGDRSGLEPELATAAARAGISHLFAVSGLHVSTVGAAAAALVQAAGLGRVARLAGLAATGLYAAVCGPGPSVVRATLMYGLAAVGRLLARQARPGTTLSLAGLVVVWLWPFWLFTPGLQLSFAAAAGLIWLGEPVRAALPLPQRFSRPLSTTIAVLVATLPVMGWHFGRVSLAGLVVNLVAVPAALVAVTSGMVTALVGLYHAGVGRVAGLVPRSALTLLRLCAHAGSLLPGAALAMPPPSRFYLCAYGCAVVAWLRPGRRRVLVLAAVVALVWGRAQVTRTGLEVVFFDVGHGDAVLLLGPEGRAVLVDTGPPGVEMSPAALRVLPYLRQQGVRRLDALVLTHAHADHYGGALDIAAAVACRQLVVATPGDDWPPAQLEAAVRARGGEVRVVAAGDAIRAGRLVLEVLYPPPGFRGDPNAGSLVLMVRYGQWSLLLTGDIPAEVELALVAQAAPHLAAQVLKVAHHGSSTSSHPAFLAATGAAHAVISAGGRFGHPAPAVEQRLREAGMTVWRTDQVGAVIVRVRGGQLEVRGYMCSVGDRAAPVESHVGGRAA